MYMLKPEQLRKSFLGNTEEYSWAKNSKLFNVGNWNVYSSYVWVEGEGERSGEVRVSTFGNIACLVFHC